MPVKKGRDFSEMSSRRQLEYESKALRAISVYAERSNKGEKYVYPELAAALRLVVDVGLSCRACGGRRGNSRRGLLCAQPGGGRASRTDQREPPSAHPHCAGQRERRITSVAPACLAKVSRLFDLDCQPAQVAAVLGPLGEDRPGLRLPGSVDTFEQGVRAILGQLVSVAMAARLTAKVARRYGEALPDAPDYVCFPGPETLALADPLALKALGMPLRRAEALIHLAQATLAGKLALAAPPDIEQSVKNLQTFPGIGRWTANYFALRGWQAKDIFLPDDYLIKQRFAGMTPAQIRRYAERWKPWRSYALLHIWYTHGWQPSMDSEIAGIQ